MGPRQTWRAMRRMGPYLVSHHPRCGPFRADVFRHRRAGKPARDYCIACFVGYPMMAAGTVLAFAFDSFFRSHPSWLGWMAVGLILALPQSLSFAGKIPNPRLQILVKVVLGVGFGFVLWGALHIPLAWGWRLAATFVLFVGLNTLWLLRFHRLERTCQACPQLALRPHCEGLVDLERRVRPPFQEVPDQPPFRTTPRNL